MDRRKFIKLSATASAISLTPLQLQAALKTVMPFVDCPDISNRKLVLINLSGGNDGLNTIVPLNQYDIYSNLRPAIKVPVSGTNKYITLDRTLASNQQIGLNPALTGVKELYDKGWVRIMQSVGYPSQNKSHFRSNDLYLTGNDGNSDANNSDGVTTGWMGRFMEEYYEKLIDQNFPIAIEIGAVNTSLGFHSHGANNLSINLTRQDAEKFYSIVNGLSGEPPLNYPDSHYGDQLRFLTDTDALTNTYSEAISAAFNKGANDTSYPDNDLSNQLKTVARLISGGLDTKIYMVHIHGFDTHDSQVQGKGEVIGSHYNLLSQLSSAMQAFMTDLESQKLADDVVGLTYSEFGRKAAENGGLGTDHGEIAPMFVFGKPVKGGVSGTNPDLSEATIDNNYQLKTVQYDYRQTFATILQNFLGANDAIIDSTFFNHTLQDSFVNLKVGDVLKSEFDVSKGCAPNQNDNFKENKNWLLYPNPFKDTVNLSSIEYLESVSFKIFNVSGVLLEQRTAFLVNNTATVDLFNYSTGMYFFEVLLSNGDTEIHKAFKI